jgi:hypothetical protein
MRQRERDRELRNFLLRFDKNSSKTTTNTEFFGIGQKSLKN